MDVQASSKKTKNVKEYNPISYSNFTLLEKNFG